MPVTYHFDMPHDAPARAKFPELLDADDLPEPASFVNLPLTIGQWRMVASRAALVGALVYVLWIAAAKLVV